MSTAIQFDIAELLEQAGARPRGNRHDCPKCAGLRTVTHSADAFFCHRCQWKGNAVSLAKELGVYQRLSPAEYRELHQRHEQTNRAARVLYERVKARRSELSGLLHTVNGREAAAHILGPDNPAAWDALSTVYGERPAVLAELAILENCRAADLIRFLSDRQDARERLIEGLLARGGLWNSQGKFVEVSP